MTRPFQTFFGFFRLLLTSLTFLTLLTFSGCWYRQCPIKGCKVKYEHQHDARIVRGRGTFPRIHFFGQPKSRQAQQESSNKRRRKRK